MNFLLFCRKKLTDLQIQQTQQTMDLSFLGACGNKVWTWISTLSFIIIIIIIIIIIFVKNKREVTWVSHERNER